MPRPPGPETAPESNLWNADGAILRDEGGLASRFLLEEPSLTMSDSPKSCANCHTERYGIYCRGYCYRCYPLITKKERVECWNVNDPSTLRELPKGGFADDDPSMIRGY